MTLSYIFTVQSGPTYYSEYMDEEFYDTEDIEWDYDIDELDVARFFIETMADPKLTKEEQAAQVAEEVMEKDDIEDLLTSYGVDNLLDASKAVAKQLEKINKQHELKGNLYKVEPATAERIVSYMMDIPYYEGKYTDELKEYFYEDAYDDFTNN